MKTLHSCVNECPIPRTHYAHESKPSQVIMRAQLKPNVDQGPKFLYTLSKATARTFDVDRAPSEPASCPVGPIDFRHHRMYSEARRLNSHPWCRAQGGKSLHGPASVPSCSTANDRGEREQDVMREKISLG